MGLKRKLEERIVRKEQEIQGLRETIQELEGRIREARAYIQGLRDTLKLVPQGPSESSRTASIRSGSLVELALQGLRRQGSPMHINALLEAIGKEPTRQNRASLSGSLGAYVRQHEIFSRPSPNTFGLLEWSRETIPSIEVPDDFGLDADMGDETADEASNG